MFVGSNRHAVVETKQGPLLIAFTSVVIELKRLKFAGILKTATRQDQQ